MAWFEVTSYLVTTTDREHELVVDLVRRLVLAENGILLGFFTIMFVYA